MPTYTCRQGKGKVTINWNGIASHLPGRDGPMVKRRFYSGIKTRRTKSNRVAHAEENNDQETDDSMEGKQEKKCKRG